MGEPQGRRDCSKSRIGSRVSGRGAVAVTTGSAFRAMRSEEQVGGHWSFALDVHGVAPAEFVAVSKALVGPLGDLNGAGLGVGFHAAGGIDRVAPEVVDELGPADPPGDDRSRVDADE